jgi:serine/threonine protein phosphatase PrpC
VLAPAGVVMCCAADAAVRCAAFCCIADGVGINPSQTAGEEYWTTLGRTFTHCGCGLYNFTGLTQMCVWCTSSSTAGQTCFMVLCIDGLCWVDAADTYVCRILPYCAVFLHHHRQCVSEARVRAAPDSSGPRRQQQQQQQSVTCSKGTRGVCLC